MNQRDTTCCIVGGGPAGIMLGFLLARAGVAVTVLEKHSDFLRDFRGDTIHPSTLELMHELGVLDEFLALPHQKTYSVEARFGRRLYCFADFSRLPVTCPFLAFMPQWDFLNFLAERGRRYPHFNLAMDAEVTDLLWDGNRVAGVRARTAQGPLDVRAALTVGCDGRGSTVRARAALERDELGAPMDVLWFRLGKKPGDPDQLMGVLDAGHFFIMIDRGDSWQCAYVIRKGSADAIRARGIEAFRETIAQVEPRFADRVAELQSWEQVPLLTVAVNRLRKWHRPGLLCIGDAAHAMSPVGGVGINLAIQDAVAAANLLADALFEGRAVDPLLPALQERREWPTRVTQRLQVIVQNNVIRPALRPGQPLKPPLPLRLMDRFPMLRRIPARFVGMGIRPEHIGTPERAPVIEAPAV